ncbi:hypothetical protein GWK47_030783 [Chionoecetes opilio]|uniref:Uncharacterized protein n=1 Tax=Chionoecetes opilio TaxID=41210 RepID=A0A8J4YX66_CHIOP|nr:hypothetical protein GWK47_030783 [Chionoecetes opilio]
MDGAAPPFQQPHPKEKRKGLITTHPRTLYRGLVRGERRSGSMDPQATLGARVTGGRTGPPPRSRQGPPASPCTCPPAYSSQGAGRKGARRHFAPPDTPDWRPGRGRRPGTPQPPRLHPLDAPPSNNPGQMAHYLQRFCVGAPFTRGEHRRTSRGKCATTGEQPVPHWCFTSCPAPAPRAPPLGARPGPAAPPAGGVLSGREGRAALMVPHTPRDPGVGGAGEPAPPPR